MVPPWYHHFFKISYIAGNGDGFTVNIPRGWWYKINPVFINIMK